ncbi:hypothetical protein ABPG74_016285 [Tetrahymena malaccensis]
MSQEKGKSEDKSQNNKDLKLPSLLDQQILATLLQTVNQNASLDEFANLNQQQDEEFDENESNHNNKDKSQEGENEDQENNLNQMMRQKQFFDAVLQQYQLIQQQQHQSQEQTQKQINQRMEEEDDEENYDEDEEGNNENGDQIEESNNEGGKKQAELKQKTFGNKQLGESDEIQQNQLLQLLMNINPSNSPLSQLQQSASNQNNQIRNNNQLEKSMNKTNQQEENQDENEEIQDGGNNQQQINISNFDQQTIQRLLQAQQAQLQSGEEDEDLEQQIRGFQTQQNKKNFMKSQGDNINKIGMQHNQMQAEEDEGEEEEEEEAKQALHKLYLEKQYKAYLTMQQQQQDLMINEIKNLDQYLNTNNLTQEQRSFAEQKQQILILKLKQLQQHLQEIGMNPNLVLEQIQLQQMQKQGFIEQDNVIDQQKKEFLLRNNAFIRGSDSIGRGLQQAQDQEQAQHQMQYQQYIQQQDKMQQNSNYQNHPLVNFFNSYSLFINDTANIQLDQEVVLNKLIENAKKCKPPSNADERVNQLWNYLTDLDKKQIEDFEQQLKSLPEQNIYECIQTIEKLHIKLLVEYNIEVARGKQLGIIKQ